MNSIEKSFELGGQVALVTGASSGLGAHFARVLAAAGASVAVCARRLDRLEMLVNEIKSAGGRAFAAEMDVNNAASVTRAFDLVAERLGTVSILVNNAGVALPKAFVDTGEADWDYVVDTNLKAVWRVGREAAARMREAEVAGSIVNIASILGIQPGLNQSLYAAAKAGVIQLTRNMAIELWRSGIRVNALCPGYFETEMNADYFATNKGRAYIQKIPPKRLGQLDELSGPLLLLASNAGSFVNGAALPVDGGHLLNPL